MTRYRIETSQKRRLSAGWAIAIAVLCLTGALGCSLSKLLVEPLVSAAVNSRQETPPDPALATRTPCPTFTSTSTDTRAGAPAPAPSPKATATPLPAGCIAPDVALLPGSADTPGPISAKVDVTAEAITSELAIGAQPSTGTEADMAEADTDASELALAEPDTSELAPSEGDAPPEADTAELELAEVETPEPAPSDTATPKPRPKPVPSVQPPFGTGTATRRPAIQAIQVAAAAPTITPTPAPEFAYQVVEIYSADTTNAFLTGYIMIVNADDIPIGGVKAVGDFDPGGAHHESSLSKWFFEGYSAPGPVLKTSSVKFEPPGSIQMGTWFIHLESEQGARLSEDVSIVTDPAKPAWFFIAFKQPGPRSTPTPTPEYDWEDTETPEAAPDTATPKPSTPTATPKPGMPTATRSNT